MFRKYIAFIPVFCICLTCFANDRQEQVEAFCNRTSTRYANISVLFKDLETGDTIASYRPDNIVPTASTLKTITTATVLETYGDTFRFPTYLETDGEINKSVLNGNLYIRGTGDPTLGSQCVGNRNFLPAWVKAIRDAGIENINGSIVADISLYDPAEAIPYGWTREDIGNFYASGVFPICYNDNTMTIFLNSGKEGTPATIVNTDPYIPYLELENHFVCGSGRDWLVSGMPYDNHRILSGNIVPDKGRWSVKAGIPNPPLLLAQTLTSTLNSNNIRISNAPYYTKDIDTKPRKIIYTHYSEPLSAIMNETNQQSNNMYAEHLFRLLGCTSLITNEKGHTQCARPKSHILISDCIDYEKQFWFNRAVNLYPTFIYDGSGLSPQDAVSAGALVSILAYMSKHSQYRDTWMASLPVSGKSGTLRSLLVNTRLEGKVVAKSGTTSRVKAYCGYIYADDGHTYVFAILVNNASVKSKVIQKEIGNLLLQMF